MTLKLNGSSSGSVSIDAPASTTSGADITFKLPVADGSADQVLSTNASGQLAFANPGVLIRKSYYEIGRSTHSNADFPNDDTTPQIDEASLIWSQAYTPSTGSCDLYIYAFFTLSETSNVCNSMTSALFISDNTNALQVRSGYSDGSDNAQHNSHMTFAYKMASWGTSAKTFSFRGGGNALNYGYYQAAFSTAIYSEAATRTAFIVEEIAT